MNRKLDYNVIMIAKGKRTSSGHSLDSSLVRTQLESIKPYIKEATPFAISDTVSPWGILRNVRELCKMAEVIHPSVIHAQWGSTTSLVGLLSIRRKRIPLVISFCGNDLIPIRNGPIGGRLRSKIAIFISKLCSRYATMNIVKSANLDILLPAKARGKTHILPNGVDITIFKPIPQEKARSLLSIDPEISIILFNTGGLPGTDIIKNVKLADSVFSIIRTKTTNVILKKIHDVPHSMMPVYYSAADVLLVTSINEGSPNVIKEAMACNLPVVTVECGDVSERLKNVSPGCVVSGYVPELIADSIQAVLHTKRRSNGRQELIRQKLEIESIAKSLVKIYDEAISTRLKL